jgi:hypothetical protein
MATQDISANSHESKIHGEDGSQIATQIADEIGTKFAADLARRIAAMSSLCDMNNLKLLGDADRCANRVMAHYSAEMDGMIEGMVDCLLDGMVKHVVQKRRKRSKTEEPSEPSPAQTLQAMKKDYIDLIVKRQQKLLLRAQTRFNHLEASREEAGRMAIEHDLASIQENSDDTEFSDGAEAVQQYICGLHEDLDGDLENAGSRLLDEIAEAKTALKTLEKLRDFVEESDI